MATPLAPVARPHQLGRPIAVALLVVGLLGHLWAAHAIGGSFTAYWHHVAGFLGILVVTGAVIALLGFKLWRTRRDILWIAIGLVQAIIGIRVAMI